MNTDPGLIVIQFWLKKRVPNKRAARVQIEITSTFSDRKCTPQLPHTTLLHAFKNHTIRSRLFFCVCVFFVLFFFLLEQCFGNQSCKICQTMAFFAFHITAILLVTLNKPRNLTGGCCCCFLVSFLIGWGIRTI